MGRPRRLPECRVPTATMQQSYEPWHLTRVHEDDILNMLLDIGENYVNNRIAAH